jgi:hypothetical protein
MYTFADDQPIAGIASDELHLEITATQNRGDGQVIDLDAIVAGLNLT